MEEKSVLLKVELDVSALKTSAKEAEERLKVLKPEMEKIRKETGTSSIEYAKIKEEVKQYTKQLNDSAAALAINEKLSKAQTNSVDELKLAQKALTVQYNALSEEERTNSEEGKKLTKTLNDVSQALIKAGEKVSDHRRKVGDYEGAIKRAYAELGVLKKEVNQIGYAYAQNQQKLEESKSALDALAASGDTTSAEYKSLTKEVEFYSEAVATNAAVLEETNAELKAQEEALAATEQEARKIGFVYGENAEQTKSLKAQLKELKAELATLDPNSEAFIEGTQRAGELADKIKDVNERVAAQTSGSGFEKLGNTFGLLTEDLANLDFEGVAEKAKAFEVIARGMTLKELIGGLKNAGSALLSLGKAILASPLFLIAAVVAAVGVAIYKLMNQTEDLTAAQDKLNSSYETQIFLFDQIEANANRRAQHEIKLAEITGKSEREILDLKIAAVQKEKDLADQRRAIIEKQIEEQFKLLRKAQEQENAEIIKSTADKIMNLKKEQVQLVTERHKYYEQDELLRAEFDADQRQKAEDAAKKAAEDARRRNQQAAEDAKQARMKIRNLMIEQDQLDSESQMKALDAEAEFEKKAVELLTSSELDKARKILSINENYLKEYTDILDQQIEAQKDALEAQAADEIANLKGTKEQIAEQRRLIEENTAAKIDEIDREAKADLLSREQELQAERKRLNETANAEFVKLNQERIATIENDLNEQTLLLEQAGKDELEILRATYQKQVELAEARNKAIQEDNTKTTEEKRAAEIELASFISGLNKQAAEEEKSLNQQRLEKAQEIVSTIGNAATELVDRFNEIQANQTETSLQNLKFSFDSQQQSLEAQLEAQVISLEYYEQKKGELEEKFREEQRKIKKQEFERNKKAQTVNAIINTAVAVTESLPNVLLAAITGALGAAEVIAIQTQPTPEFAHGGKVLSGKRIGSSDGVSISRPNGDNLLATVKTGEVILNEAQQAALGGAQTFAAIGVPGFATGGAVLDSVSNGVVSQRVNNSFEQMNDLKNAFAALPSPTVIVQDIAEGLNNAAFVQDEADI